jgi:hypothetical protein
MLKYDYDYILSIKSNYTIDENKLEELKKFNVPLTQLSKKQQQLNIKYQSNKWRYNDKEDLFKKKINGVLNKISLDNYEELKNMVKNIGNNISIDRYDDMDYFVERIVNKALDDPFYSHVYGKLLKDICKYKWFCNNPNNIMDCTYISFYEILLYKIKQLYDEIFDSINTNKVKCVNTIELVNQLYLNNLLSETIYISCLYGLLNNPTELNIELVCKMLLKSGPQINSKNLNPIMNRIDLIYNSNTNNSRLKYLLLDVIELNQDGWNSKETSVVVDDDLDEKIYNILDEYILNENIEDILYILEPYTNDKLSKVIELCIKYSFNFATDKQQSMCLLTCEIIKNRQLVKNDIITVIKTLINNLDDLRIDSPKCDIVLNDFINKYISSNIINIEDLKLILADKPEHIKKMFNSFDFNIVKPKKGLRDLSVLKDKPRRKN